MSKLRVLDLFSGVGAYSLGLERTGGFQTVAYCEIEKFPANILRKNSPNVPVYFDVKTVTGAGLRADGVVPDWIVGGWPCQGNSPAGTGLGMDDPRSGLWSEIARVAGEVRPEGLLLENSSNLLNINEGRDFGRVLGDLAALGYDAEWHCLSAAAFDAPHIRDRVWIIATLADAHSERCGEAGEFRCAGCSEWAGGGGSTDADPDGAGLAISQARCGRTPRAREALARCAAQRMDDVPYADRLAPFGTAIARQERHAWEPEPDVVRVVSRRSPWLDGVGIDDAEQSCGTREILQVLRGEVPSGFVQWPARGFEHVQTAEILLDKMLLLKGAPEQLGHISLARSPDEGVVLRGVWFHGKAACPSCRCAAAKQRSVEHPDALRILPQLLACDCGSTWVDPTGQASSNFRADRIRALGNLNPPIIAEAWGRAILSAKAAA